MSNTIYIVSYGNDEYEPAQVFFLSEERARAKYESLVGGKELDRPRFIELASVDEGVETWDAVVLATSKS